MDHTGQARSAGDARGWRVRRAISPQAFLAPLAPVALVVGSLAATAPAVASITVIDSAEVLAHHTAHALDGALLFIDAAGAQHRLVTDIHAPEISNPGDGAFHPAAVAHVAAAIAALPPSFVAALDVTIYLLPYPRASCLASSASEQAVYVSPLVVADAEGAETARVVTHELGHCVHHSLLPDSDLSGWQEYAQLRGIDDATRFTSSAPHADRPHEIFAEDFRVLFGSALARGNGAVENDDIAPPLQVAGLGAFLFALSDAPANVAGVDDDGSGEGNDEGNDEGIAALGSGWLVAPQPAARGEVVRLFHRGEGARAEGNLRAEVFDAQGRRVLAVDARTGGETIELPGVDGLASGAYWIRLSTETREVIGSALTLRILP